MVGWYQGGIVDAASASDLIDVDPTGIHSRQAAVCTHLGGAEDLQ